MDKVLAWDRRHAIRPLPLRSAEADRLLDGMSDEERMGSWHLVTADGHVHSGGDAFPHLMRLLPAGAPIGAVAAAMPGVTDRVYRWIAGHRDDIAKVLGTQACAVDPTERRKG